MGEVIKSYSEIKIPMHCRIKYIKKNKNINNIFSTNRDGINMPNIG